MRLGHIWVVLQKEVKDMARDRRTLVSSLLIPLILYPVLFGLMGMGMDRLDKDINENITVALSAESDTPDVRGLLTGEVFAGYENIRLVELTRDPLEMIRRGQVRFVLTVSPEFADIIARGDLLDIAILYDDSDARALGSLGIISGAIERFGQRIVQQRLLELGIDPALLRPLTVVRNTVPVEHKGSNQMIVMMLPMMAAIMIAVGGIPAATDLVAGEKERGTFEPLLTTRPGRASLLLGKYIAVTLFSMVSVISQGIGMLLGALVNPGIWSEGGSQASLATLGISPLALLLTILVVLALGMIFAGVQLSISTYSRSFKEAQTYLSFLIFAAMIPAYATMMLQPSDLSGFMFVIPVLNAIAALKMLLGGVINYGWLLIALGSSAVFVAVSLLFSAHLFNRESVLFRS